MKRISCLILSLLPAASVLAGQSITPIGSGFANVSAGTQYFGSFPNPGDGFNLTPDQYVNTLTNYGSPASASVTNSGAQNGHPFSNSATAFATPGFIKVGATNSGMPAITFPAGAAYGGWNDNFTITGGVGSAIWLAPLLVQGDLHAAGFGALTRVGIAAYENHNFVQPYGDALHSAAYNDFLALNGGNVNGGIRNSVIAFGWDFQGAFYGAVDNGPANAGTNVLDYNINRSLYFAIPFTYGVPFEAGFYIGGEAGEGGAGADFTPNGSSFDFTHTVLWGGAGSVVDVNGVANPTFTVASASGFDYNQAAIPEPATLGMLATALVSMLAGRRRRG